MEAEPRLELDLTHKKEEHSFELFQGLSKSLPTASYQRPLARETDGGISDSATNKRFPSHLLTDPPHHLPRHLREL